MSHLESRGSIKHGLPGTEGNEFTSQEQSSYRRPPRLCAFCWAALSGGGGLRCAALGPPGGAGLPRCAALPLPGGDALLLLLLLPVLLPVLLPAALRCAVLLPLRAARCCARPAAPLLLRLLLLLRCSQSSSSDQEPCRPVSLPRTTACPARTTSIRKRLGSCGLLHSSGRGGQGRRAVAMQQLHRCPVPPTNLLACCNINHCTPPTPPPRLTRCRSGCSPACGSAAGAAWRG